MEVFKLAFETLIIGLFALPWLWVMIDLVNPKLFNSLFAKRLIASIPTELRPTVIGVALFSIVYLLGSMITPVATQFLNDSDMLGRVLPTEEKIEASNFPQKGAPEYSGLGEIERVGLPVSKAEVERVHIQFEREESTLLLRGTDQTTRLNRIHEQLTVLQGATFSAFALMVLCGFGWCGQFSKNPSETGWKRVLGRQLRWSAAFVVACGMVLLAAKGFWVDSHNLASGDMPIAELVLLLLGGFGLYILSRGTRSRFKIHGLTFVFALLFTLLCYTGYGCTERSYDQAIVSTFQALGPSSSDGDHPAAQFTMASSNGE